ncbi:hypothetical protein ARMSODRAFT_318787 [Armillaria solidipes]|uniref:Uncharacterized protein n=1 Tax=Armillaria solidipes TaxID=1076256 RepID=A0A2H3BNI5_9AGAR|nr:hypothetical protein ARMSODRAFT_318787 [Armillaria solidipes]
MSWVLWSHPSERYIPSEQDVVSVKRILITYVPYELVEEILEIAQYWPGIRGDRKRTVDVLGEDHPGESCTRAEWCFIVAPPIPQGAKVRAVRFMTVGFEKGVMDYFHDNQGTLLARGFKQQSYAGGHGGYGRWKEGGRLICMWRAPHIRAISILVQQLWKCTLKKRTTVDGSSRKGTVRVVA